MAFTQDQLDALEKAIAEGTLTVKYRDRLVTYRTLDEMLKIRDLMKSELAPNSKPKTVRLKAKFCKGLDE